MRRKELQEVIHMLVRLIEPKLLPQTSPESLNFFETDQLCFKPVYLYIFNKGMAQSANVKGNFLDGLNFNRIDEDAYLEVKMLREELDLDGMVRE